MRHWEWIRWTLPGPARLVRYLVGPADRRYRVKYDAMSPEAKETARWRSMKLDGFYRAFPAHSLSARRSPTIVRSESGKSVASGFRFGSAGGRWPGLHPLRPLVGRTISTRRFGQAGCEAGRLFCSFMSSVCVCGHAAARSRVLRFLAAVERLAAAFLGRKAAERSRASSARLLWCR